MILNGAGRPHRALAFLLSLVLLLTTCYIPAHAADIWAETAFTLYWTDGQGQIHVYPAMPVEGSDPRAYWVRAESSAMGTTLHLEALCPDPAYSFFFLDDMGGHMTAFDWMQEMDAPSRGEEYAYQLWYTVDGVMADMPILLYVSSIPMPSEKPFESYPVPVTVNYVAEDGTLLDQKTAECWAGETTPVWASSRKTAGYELISPDGVDVYVDEKGNASPAEVTFIYRQIASDPTEAPTATPVSQVHVPVVYVHLDGEQLDFQERILPPGTHWVEADSSKTGSYKLVSDEAVQITVYPDGSTDLASVVFYYDDVYTAPAEAELTILYQLDDHTVIANESRMLPPGEHTILPDSSRIGTYVLTGEQSHSVYVDEQGRISADTVTFGVRYAAVNITVHYQDELGRSVAPDQVRSFTEDGDYPISADPQGLPGSYEPAPGLQTTVTVSVRNGVASQNDVYFYYQQKQSAPALASVTVHYYDTLGKEIAASKTITLEPGTHYLEADPDNLPQGYELALDEAIKVEVYENGTFSPQEVAFYYRPVQAEEKQATVTVLYKDDRGNEVALRQVKKLGEGTHSIQAEPEDLLQGYEIFVGTESSVQVTVRNGVPSQSQVVFYYQYTAPVQEQVKYNLPVLYYDTEGRQIASTQYVKAAPGTYSIKANPEDLPQGYELAMDEYLSVTVFDDGSTNPAEIAFYYKPPQKKATVIVIYADEKNQPIIDPFTEALTPGSHTIQADPARVPEGYDPASAQGVKVYVSGQGKAEPEQVTLIFRRQAVETPIPVGAEVNRYANVKSSDVAFRNEPSTSGGKKTVIKRLSKNTKVFVLTEMYNDKNEVWAMVNVDGRIGYMMSSFLDILTQEKSDAHAAGSTPVPTLTPIPDLPEAPTPTATPTQTPTEAPTDSLVESITPPPSATPTLEPIPEEPAPPTPTASPAPYTGYALTTRATALRTGISASDMTIIQTLEANELVRVVDQVTDSVTGETWAIVSTLSKQPGYVPYSALRPITDKEAQPYLDYWAEVNKTAEPTQLATATPEPPQLIGYGVVIGDGVPFRQMQSEFSRIIDNLDADTIVYVTGQTPGDGQYWHSVNYENRWGYIRTDLVRMMTLAEEEAYIESQRATPTPATTNLPFDADGMSSYGYVDGSSVNWRETPSTSGKRVGELKRYAFCLVLDSERVGGVTWYLVSYGDKSGYIHGDFFKQMTISELEDFLGSDEYLQGIANNSASGDSAMDDVGYPGTGGIVTWEDQWVSNNQDAYASFAPFNPIGTVAPIATAIPTLEPLPGWYTDAPTATPSPTPTFNPMPDVTYPTTDDGEGGSAILWAVVSGLLLLAVGGVFALVRYNQNRRRIAMRAAQRRAQAARAQQQRPYARTANPSQPRTGMYQQQTPVRRPASQQSDQNASQYAPYSGTQNYPTGTFRRPADSEGAAPAPAQRVGRRTAYRQAQEAVRRTQENQDNELNL